MDLDMYEFWNEEIDFDYEYDAAMYYDFTRPESDFESLEAERWFDSAAYYPPSPLIIKLNWEPSVPVKSGHSSFICRAVENINRTSSSMDSEVTSAGSEIYSEARSQTKSPLSKYSHFMNPTASQLAKQNRPPQIHCDRLLRRSQKFVKNEDKSSRSSCTNGTQATKRQKLEAGYLCKVARLKHQSHFLHKEPKKVGLTEIHTKLAKPKVTIPREPNLETAFRAERHRSKINLDLVETENSKPCTFRARPLNRKILEAPSLPLSKKSTPQLPEFQVFHLRTSARAMQHQFINEANSPNCSPSRQNETIRSIRVIPVAGLKEKLEAQDKFKARCLNKKERNFPTDKRFPNEPPIDLFSKLSLTSEVNSNTKCRSKMTRHSKDLKENAPGSSHLGQQMKSFAKSPRLGGNHFQCGSDRMISSVVPQINRITVAACI
ncbi:protein TPX2 isoform X2 [Ricinus communis]|uniref:protein TPX2 isoform X2 n=1 Tax=Ricinus communis TaxID=3988 RepID=UPI0007725333|nr:protein TPX2 isoform X2 [Ricinus communis]|eukprot:XP_015580309.1 protein TPX2 isoform X2 [Ricinus communis]